MQEGPGGNIYLKVLRSLDSSNATQINVYGEKKADKVAKTLDGEFDITDEGEIIEDYLGVNWDHNEDGSFRMYQPHLLSKMIKAILGVAKESLITTQAFPTVHLNKDIDRQERKESWNYRPVIGMLHLFAKSTHSELAHSVHQCIRFCETPKASHERVVKHILKYLLTTQPTKGKEPPKNGLNMKPDMSRGIKVYLNALFAGDWSKCRSEEPASVLFRTGYVKNASIAHWYDHQNYNPKYH
eukprot:6673569-Ditylum_brightwellii.AAC.2